MTCPDCKRAMIILEVDDVEVDFCVGCKGKWLDAGEMDLLLDGAENRERIVTGMHEATDVANERDRACPICDKKMEKVRCSPDADTVAVILDRCPKGDGLWFDDGELRRVLEFGDFPGERRIYDLFNSIFGGD